MKMKVRSVIAAGTVLVAGRGVSLSADTEALWNVSGPNCHPYKITSTYSLDCEWGRITNPDGTVTIYSNHYDGCTKGEGPGSCNVNDCVMAYPNGAWIVCGAPYSYKDCNWSKWSTECLAYTGQTYTPPPSPQTTGNGCQDPYVSN